MHIARLALIAAACAVLISVQAPGVSASEMVPIMTVPELEPGMTGIGKTVIAGTEISTFNFEIIGVLEKGGFTGGPLILVRCWGPAIDASGGIAGGYSGSPLFIGDKLIGAISTGWYFAEGDIAGVTPINDMLRAFNYPGSSRPFCEEMDYKVTNETVLPKPLIHRGRTYEKVLLAGSESQLEGRDVSEETIVLLPTRTPLMVGGLSHKYFPLVKRELEKRMPFIEVLQGNGSGPIPKNFTDVDLEPGAAIGVQLISGDIDLTAVGTLTYIDDDGRILAFGHPFLMSGFIEMPLTTARIIHTVASIQRSFKVGEAIEMVGRIEQDRGTCVAGSIGEKADMLDIKVTIVDEDLEWKDTYNCSIIRDEDIMAYFWMFVPFEGMYRTLDRSDAGMMNVSFKLDAEGFEEPISMQNTFYSGDSFGAFYAASELAMIMEALTSRNIYRDVRINSIELDITVRDENQTVNIMRARSIMPEREEASVVEEELLDVEEIIEGEMEEEEIVGESEGVSSTCVLLRGGRTYDFIGRNVPERPLVYLASNPFTREMIRLNAGDEVLEAVKEYVEGMEEEEEFYEVPKYYAGETVEVMVSLQPYREKVFEQLITLQIPDDYPTGTYDVSIFGGSSFYGGYFDPFMMLLGMTGGYYGGYGIMPETLEEMIEQMTERDPNDVLVMSLAPIYSEDPYAYLREDYEDPEPIKTVLPMDGVIYGAFYLPIEIIDESTEEGDEWEDMGMEGEMGMEYPDISMEMYPPPPG
jgi:hypothetical protein